MAGPTTTHDDTKFLRDVTVCSVAGLPVGTGAAPAVIDVLADVESVEIDLPERVFKPTSGPMDLGHSSRAVQFGEGSIRITCFSRATASRLATIFAQSSKGTYSFAEGPAGSGDSYQLIVTNKKLTITLGADANKHVLSTGVEGVPYLNNTAMNLQ